MTDEESLKEAIERAIYAHDLLMNTMEAQLQRMEPDEDDDSEAAAQAELTHEAVGKMLRRADDHLGTAILWMREIQQEMDGAWLD
jgi:hypothetical protein